MGDIWAACRMRAQKRVGNRQDQRNSYYLGVLKIFETCLIWAACEMRAILKTGRKKHFIWDFQFSSREDLLVLQMREYGRCCIKMCSNWIYECVECEKCILETHINSCPPIRKSCKFPRNIASAGAAMVPPLSPNWVPDVSFFIQTLCYKIKDKYKDKDTLLVTYNNYPRRLSCIASANEIGHTVISKH